MCVPGAMNIYMQDDGKVNRTLHESGCAQAKGSEDETLGCLSTVEYVNSVSADVKRILQIVFFCRVACKASRHMCTGPSTRRTALKRRHSSETALSTSSCLSQSRWDLLVVSVSPEAEREQI